MAGRRASAPPYGPRWLAAQLQALLPQFPRVSLCVAFSGGADSTALLAAASRLKPAPRSLRALHVDHGLHRDAARWRAHCRRVAHELGVSLAVRSARVVPAPGESLEAAARAERYRALGDALAAGEALLTAHTQDDQLETVLLQMLRGAGLAGLAAMPARAPFAGGLLVRPLLPLSRIRLAEWLREAQLGWIEDPGNADPRLDRNYLRHEVLPALRARWPAAGATVARAAAHAAEAQRLLEALGAADADPARCGAGLAVPVLRRLPPDRRRNALRHWIGAAGLRMPPAGRLGEIATALLAARHDAHPHVDWDGARVQRHGDVLELKATTGGAPRPHGRGRRVLRRPRPATAVAVPAAAAPEVEWRWRDRSSRVLRGDFGLLALRRDAHGPLDLGALPAVLTVRARRGGERLQPVRGGPRRSLKRLLQEARVPLEQRAALPLVYAGERLVAAADLWVDAAAQAGAHARRRARLTWRPRA